MGKYAKMMATEETGREAPWEMGTVERAACAPVMEELASFPSDPFSAEIRCGAVIDAAERWRPVLLLVAREATGSRDSGGGIAGEPPHTASRMEPRPFRGNADQHDSRRTCLAYNNIRENGATLHAVHDTLLRSGAISLPEAPSAWTRSGRASAPRSRSYVNSCSMRLGLFGPNRNAHHAGMCPK